MLFDGEKVVPPRPMNDKQLMVLYEVKDRHTWRKMLYKIRTELIARKNEGRYCYNIKEVIIIFEHLGRPRTIGG